MMFPGSRSIVFALGSSWLRVAAANNGTFTCSLNCVNSGYCEYVTGSDAELKAMLQSGIMIMQCVCPEQYTGLGCEQARPICNLSTLKCPNGAPCDPDPHNPTQYNCDCSIADTISPRASQFCRRTYTEYCYSGGSNQLKRDTAMGIAFCTNGGKCKGDLIAAREAPWNTSANALYEQAGCQCPAEYYGPHCEFLHHEHPVPEQVFPNSTVADNETAYPTKTMEPSMMNTPSLEDLIGGFDNQSSTNLSIGDDDNQSDGLRITLICVLLSVGVVCTTLAILTYRHRHTKQRRSILLRLKVPSPLTSPNSMTSHSNTTNDLIQQTSLTKERAPPTKTNRLQKKTKKKKRPSTTAGMKVIRLTPALSADEQDIVSLTNDSYHHHSLMPFVVDEEEEEDGSQQQAPKESLWQQNESPQEEEDPLSTPVVAAVVAPNETAAATPWSARVTNLAAAMVRPGGSAATSVVRRQNRDVYVLEDDDDEALPSGGDDEEDVHLNQYDHASV
jgi:hypothetical protein